MEKNDLSEGEELSKETCFDILCTTFRLYLINNTEKFNKFRSLTEYIVSHGVVGAVRHSKSKVVFFYNKNQMTKTESYDLLSNIYSRFFAGIISMNTFLYLGCSLFDCYETKKDSICRALKRHKAQVPPPSYTNFFDMTKFICP